MKKTFKNANFINSINEILSIAREREIVHLVTQDKKFTDNHITINGKSLINFGSCSYLGLELDERLIEGGIDALKRYGSQFSSSRTYVSFTLYEELEELLSKIFGHPVIISTCSTLGHQSVIPIIIEDDDAVIFDQQAHISMQDTKEKLIHRGVPITVLRHNKLDDLEMKIQELSLKHNRIWYFLDGIYSMYGDIAPIIKLHELQEKFKQLYLYVDDAHGMSWAGKNGSGFILNNIRLNERIILTTSLAKGFGSVGGVFVIPDKELYWKVKNWGGPLTYSGPQQPSVIGCSIASAKIHLSDEINERQKALEDRIAYCNEVMKFLKIPLVSESISPIFFVGLGLTKVGYNMVRRLINDGFHINLGIFPAVPENCTGIRFTTTLHHSKDDIEQLAHSISKNIPQALKEENRSVDDIYRAFKSLRKTEMSNEAYLYQPVNVKSTEKFSVIHETKVSKIDSVLWDDIFKDKGAFDSINLQLLEDTFSNNPLPENNWKFHYFIITDSTGEVVLATLFTSVILKDDIFSPADVSSFIEDERKLNPYYLTGKCLMMGTLITDGEHLYLNKSNPFWKDALSKLIDNVWIQQEKEQASSIIFRDFHTNDDELKEYFHDQGFIKTDIPSTHVIINQKWKDEYAYLKSLTAKHRGHINHDVLKDQDYTIFINDAPSEDQIENYYRLYNNVRVKNKEINTFPLPLKFFKEICRSKNWECIELHLAKLPDEFNPVAIILSYKNSNYCPIIVGIDYQFKQEKVYKKILYESIKRGIHLQADKIYLGLTTSLEKRKLGAEEIPKCIFYQSKDNYNNMVVNLVAKKTR